MHDLFRRIVSRVVGPEMAERDASVVRVEREWFTAIGSSDKIAARVAAPSNAEMAISSSCDVTPNGRIAPA